MNSEVFYSGSIENIEDILYKKKVNNKEEWYIKSGKHLLVYLLNTDYFKYLKLFQKNTEFLILSRDKRSIYRADINYNDYMIFSVDDDFYNIYFDYLSKTSSFYAKIGKEVDKDIEKKYGLFLIANLFICFLITYIFFKL